MSEPVSDPTESGPPKFRVTYTKLAGLVPPRQGSVIRFNGVGQDGRLFRVLNTPEVDEKGAFTIDLEPVA